MKSRNLKAIFAALTTAAVMATATTSFAAVTSTATYSDVDGKVKIYVDVDGTETVTYKAKCGDEIVYIDQTNSDFSYYVDSAKVANMEVSVESNNGSETIDFVESGYDATPSAPTCTTVPGEGAPIFVLQKVGKPKVIGVKCGERKFPSLAPAGASKVAVKVVLDGVEVTDFEPYAE